MSTNFSLSYELVYLMAWLLKHEKGKLKNMIEEVVKKGLAGEISQVGDYPKDSQSADLLHVTILDFLIFLEDSLLESLEKNQPDRQTQEKIKTTLQKINPQSIDLKTLWASTRQTQTLLTQPDSNDDLKRTLLFQILKNWKPKENEPLN
jgi:hypothetical protein